MRLRIGLLLGCLVLLPMPTGCNKKPQAPTPEAAATKPLVLPKPPEPKKEKAGGKDLISTIARRMEISEVRNFFREIGIAYQGMEAEGSPPKNLDDFKRYLKTRPEFFEPVEKGWVKILYGVKSNQYPEGRSNTILAYEVDADRNGIRVVMMGDGSVQELNLTDFEKAPKAQGR